MPHEVTHPVTVSARPQACRAHGVPKPSLIFHKPPRHDRTSAQPAASRWSNTAEFTPQRCAGLRGQLQRAGREIYVSTAGVNKYHHVFPQADEFRHFFGDAAISIHNFTVPLPTAVHRGVHRTWNHEWRAFMRGNPGATRSQIYDQAYEMYHRAGLGGPITSFPGRWL